MRILLFGSLPGYAQYTTTIPFTETFDDESHFTEGGDLPDGWTQYAAGGNAGVERMSSVESYEDANSGEYYLQSYGMSSGRQDVLFTPMLHMEAGTTYTISAYVRANAYQTGRIPSVSFTIGNAQTVEAQTETLLAAQQITHTQFERVETTFTPTVSGEYSVALQITCNLSSSGFAMVDDFTIEEAPKPADPWVTTIPFTEGFDDDAHFALGGELPDSWAQYAAGGNAGFTRENSDDTWENANSGKYYLQSYGMSAGRQDVLFTPLLHMEAGTEYTISAYVRAASYQTGRIPSVSFTIGNAQTVEAQTVTLLEAQQITNTQFERVEVKYTPEVSGDYSVALQVTCNLSSSGFVMVDDFTIDGEAPEPSEPWVTTVPFTETFDDDAHYVLGGDLPDSWASTGTLPFTAIDGSEYSITPYSGSKILFAPNSMENGRSDVVYTPMLQLEGGKSYKVSFYLMLTGGSRQLGTYKITAGAGQTEEAQTMQITSASDVSCAEWTKVEAEFAVSESGEYSIAFWANSAMSNCGYYCIDDFTVEEGGTAEPPVEEWKPSIPYAENFDDAEHYDRISNLPIGWYSSGETPFFTASSTSIPAVSGQYYMITLSSVIANRQDIAYSPLLEMEAGKEYKVSFYLCMPGSTATPKFKFTVGQEQASNMQETTLLELDQTVDDWTRYEFTFMPETTGEYCFAFWACSDEAGDGYICVDNFRLSLADKIFAPETSFEFGNTLHSIFTGSSVVYPGQAVKLINETDDAKTYEWSVNKEGAEISDAAAINPTISFSEAGSYTVTLKATNDGGTKEASRTIRVTFPEENESDAWQNTDDSTDKLFQQDAVPAFLEDGTVEDVYTYETYQNYVVGVNQYYRAFAERFEVPAGCKMDLTSITFNSMEYYLFDQQVGIYDDNGEFVGYSTFDKEKQMSVVIYPEKDGKPDTDNPLYTKTDLISNILVDDYKPVRIAVNFDEAVAVDGTFYVALEFDSLTIEPFDTQMLSRSYFGGDTRVHANGQTTLWVKPESAIPGSEFEKTGTLNEYCRADEFSRELVGYSFCVMPWVTYGESVATGIGESVADESGIKVSVSLDGNNFRLDGLKAGSDVRVYSVNGAAVYSGKSAGSDIVIPAGNWAKGIYVISAGGQSFKVMR